MTTEPLPRTGTEVVVELRGIKKSFGSTEVLHGVDLTIHTGEHVVIFGPSGSGKSTLLRTINLLEEPHRGLGPRCSASSTGRACRARRASAAAPLQLRRHVGMVFQQFNLFPHLTALHNIALALRSVQGHGPARGGGAGRRSRSGRSGCSATRATSPQSSPAGSSSASRSPAR